MEQANTTHEELFPEKQGGCANCGHIVITEGLTPLCKDCRDSFIKYPIPNSIKLFGGLIIVLLIMAMTKLPKNLSAGIHYQRGNEAMKQDHYHTAQKEFAQVIKLMPAFKEAKEHLAIASFHNTDLEVFFKTVNQLIGKQVADQDTYYQLEELIRKASDYLPSDSFGLLIEEYGSIDSITEESCKRYIREHQNEIFPQMQYAGLLYNNEKYIECDSKLNEILAYDEKYVPGLNFKTSIKRQLRQYDSAGYYTDKILALNKESTYGMASKARIFLMQKRNAEGLQWALKSIAVNNMDQYAKATLALAYHFNHKLTERDKLMAAAKQDSTAAEYMSFVNDVISGKEKFQD